MVRFLAAFLLLVAWCAPANAAVTITFWSHELGKDFPHAFFTLRGVPDAGGAPIDVNYGFTASSLTPAILMGNVRGRLDIAKPSYMRGSDAQFSVVMSDAQYADILALVHEWGEVNTTYNLNHRNCVHFVQEAARRVGLVGTDLPQFVKKPRSFMLALAAANKDKVTIVAMHGSDYFAGLTPLAAPSSALAVVSTPAVPRAVNY